MRDTYTRLGCRVGTASQRLERLGGRDVHDFVVVAFDLTHFQHSPVTDSCPPWVERLRPYLHRFPVAFRLTTEETFPKVAGFTTRRRCIQTAAAGLGRVANTGRIIDQFRDRLVLARGDTPGYALIQNGQDPAEVLEGSGATVLLACLNDAQPLAWHLLDAH